MNILSLFDGISCGQVALQRAGIKVNKYYASEIDKHAITVTQKNHPSTIQLGDVTAWRDWELPKIDLLIGGSPCQGFSFAGKQLNFDDPRSKLFFDYVDILNHFKPKHFLLENVKMKKEYQDIISDYLGVEPVEINSNLVSAQNRRRLYWTNIPRIEQPNDRGIMLKDIVHENIDVDYSACAANGKAHALTASYDGAVWWNSFERHQRTMVFEELAEYIVPFDKTLQILEKEVEKGKIKCIEKNGTKIYQIHGVDVEPLSACGCYTGDSKAFNRGLLDDKSRSLKSGRHDASVCIMQKARGFNKGGIHTDKSPTLTSNSWEHNNHLFGCITPDRINKRQNGQRFNDGRKFYTLTAQDQHGILVEGYIRKLTPIECERLQTLPDKYTEGISKTQRYKALGNGWTVDVIAHILKSMEVGAAK
jgi:DNA-cytosine methyltransferase